MVDHRIIFIAVALGAAVVGAPKLLAPWRRSPSPDRAQATADAHRGAVLARVGCRACPTMPCSVRSRWARCSSPSPGLSRSDWWSNYGRYSQKIVDFVVVDLETAEVAAVVELDDRSHDTEKDAARDALMACGGYDVVRISVNERLDARSLRARLFGGDAASNVRAIGSARLAR